MESCSFCTGNQENRAILLAGRNAHICNECLLTMITVVMKKGLQSAYFVNRAIEESVESGAIEVGGLSPHEDLREKLGG